MRKPNFFVIGAPKCGTTALCEYLREHPNVFVSTPKEPHYFATDLPKYREVVTENEYLNLFAHASKQQYAIGEGSVYYLYSKEALQHIKAFAPEAKIIAMLRNPVDLVYSLHSQLCYNQDESELDFRRAWALNEERKQGLDIPKYCRDIKLLYYDEVAKLGDQVNRLYEIFPHEQVKLIFFEDFSKETKQVYMEVLDFLGLPDDHRREFPKVNINRRHNYRWLATFTQHPPPFLVRSAMRAKALIGLDKWGVLDFLRQSNKTTQPREKLDSDLATQIRETYRDDISKLSQLTNRDLTVWLSSS